MPDGERFAAAMARLVAVLPFGLSRVVAPSLVGFVLLNACTFSIDIGLLTTLHGGLHWPLPVSISISYGTAFTLSYLLNRRLNFRSHAAVGGQLPIYVAVVALNLGQALDRPGQLLLQARHLGTGTGQQRGGRAVLLVQQGQQQVLGLDELLVAAVGQALGVGEGLLEYGGEFVHAHDDSRPRM